MGILFGVQKGVEVDILSSYEMIVKDAGNDDARQPNHQETYLPRFHFAEHRQGVAWCLRDKLDDQAADDQRRLAEAYAMRGYVLS